MRFRDFVHALKACASLAAVTSVAACGAIPFPFDDGGMMNVAQVPTETMVCDRDFWEPVSRTRPHYSDDYMTYLLILEGHRASRTLNFSFDLRPDADGIGRPANIRFDGPQQFLDNDGTRPAIKANGEAITRWTYGWIGDGAPVYARDCHIALALVMRG